MMDACCLCAIEHSLSVVIKLAQVQMSVGIYECHNRAKVINFELQKHESFYFYHLKKQFMAKKKKYYVVWKGHRPGVYGSWEECKAQINGFGQALYKSFGSEEEAKKALQQGPGEHIGKGVPAKSKPARPSVSRQEIIWDSISVDAACSGNPGVMEYQGVDTRTKEKLFYKKFPLGTNNIGEFLAIVHALALTQKQGLETPVYSDSQTAMGWVRRKRCKTLLVENQQTAGLFDLIRRAEAWLAQNRWNNPLLKWETDSWGEIPADFGRKS